MTKSRNKTKWLVRIAILSGIAFLLMYLEFSVPFFPVWLKLDASDMPALLGAFALGPWAGVCVEAVKCVLFFALKNSNTGGVGEMANFVLGAILCLSAGYVYRRKHTQKGALLALSTGVLAMSLLGALINLYVLLPFYANLMSKEAILGMAMAVSPSLNSFEAIALYAVIPFNLLKGVLISAITLLMYKRVSPMLQRWKNE